MALVNSVQKNVFDTDQIHEGDLIYVENKGWNEPRKGIVIYVSAEKITFLYHPQIANVTNRQDISSDEAVNGDYLIRWSGDMSTIGSYGKEENDA